MSNDGDVTLRWIDGPTATDADWESVEKLLTERGWMSLNRNLSRILLAERAGELVGFHVFQLLPYAGPLYVAPRERGTGLAERLADDMLTFLADAQARGFIVVADSPFAQKLCEGRGMTRLNSPVYVMGGER